MSTQDTNHDQTPTDPTPRTAATARERLEEEREHLVALEMADRFAIAIGGTAELSEDDFRAALDHLIALAATEAPGRVAALEAALRAIAAREPAPAIPGCTCDPDSATDDDGNLVMCDLHEPMLRHLRWETLASLVIDYQAFMRHALAVADAALAALAAPTSPAGVSGEVCLGCGEPEEPRRIPCCSNCSCPIPFAPTPTPSEPVGRCAVCGDGPDEGVHKGQTSGSAFHAYWPDPFTPATRDE